MGNDMLHQFESFASVEEAKTKIRWLLSIIYGKTHTSMLASSFNAQQTQKMWEDYEQIFFLSPASTYKKYHSAYDGGLAVHSYNTTKILLDLVNMFVITNDESEEDLDNIRTEVIFAGLFHDIGKCGIFNGKIHIPYYIKETSDWHRNTLGRMYIVNEDIDISHEELSMFIFTQYRIKLPQRVYKAILYHNGMYERQFAFKKGDWLPILLHQADMISVKIDNK
jgi:hypothetical protein